MKPYIQQSNNTELNWFHFQTNSEYKPSMFSQTECCSQQNQSLLMHSTHPKTHIFAEKKLIISTNLEDKKICDTCHYSAKNSLKVTDGFLWNTACACANKKPRCHWGTMRARISWNLVKCCINVQRIALEKACNRGMTFKVIQGH